MPWNEPGVGETSFCNSHLPEGCLGAGKYPQQNSVPGVCPLHPPSSCHILSPQRYIPQRKVILHSRPEDYGQESSLCCPGNTHVALSHRYPPPPTTGWGWGLAPTHPSLKEHWGIWVRGPVSLFLLPWGSAIQGGGELG